MQVPAFSHSGEHNATKHNFKARLIKQKKALAESLQNYGMSNSIEFSSTSWPSELSKDLIFMQTLLNFPIPNAHKNYG